MNKVQRMAEGFGDGMRYGTEKLFDFYKGSEFTDPYHRGYMHALRLKFGIDRKKLFDIVREGVVYLAFLGAVLLITFMEIN